MGYLTFRPSASVRLTFFSSLLGATGMGTGKTDGGRAMLTHLLWLRRKLCEDASNPTYIFAEQKVGYRMAEQVAE